MTTPSGATLHEFSVGVRVRVGAPYQSIALLVNVANRQVTVNVGLSVKWLWRAVLVRWSQAGVVLGPLFAVVTVERAAGGRLVS